MDLKPVSYSKAQTGSDFCSLLEKSPKQVCNSEEAFKGYVMEFELLSGGLPGTLSEYYATTGDTCYKIHFDNSGVIEVERNTEGSFLIKENNKGV